MLPPLSHIFEICLYSLLNFFPFLIFALYPFRDDLRFSRTKTGLLIVVLTFLQILFGLLARFSTGNISAILSLISTLSYAIFLLCCHQKITRPAFIRTAYDFEYCQSDRHYRKVSGRAVLPRFCSFALPLFNVFVYGDR